MPSFHKLSFFVILSYKSVYTVTHDFHKNSENKMDKKHVSLDFVDLLAESTEFITSELSKFYILKIY